MAHAGSLWGLPDFGITEALTSRRTSQGGSDIFANKPTSQASTGDILGIQDWSNAIYPPADANAWRTYVNQNKSGGGGGGGGGGSFQQPAPAPAGFNPKDPNQNPGPGWFWDAADGWKQVGGGDGGVNAEVDRIRGDINAGYDAYQSGLGNLEGFYNTQMGNSLGSVGNIYNNIFSGLDSARQAAMDKLAGNRGQVGQRVAQSAQDLAANLRGMVRNTGMQLGAMGAGDTSASNIMAPYAYTKLAGNEYGKIQRQGNDQLFQIDTQEKETQDQYNQMRMQSEIEKETQLQGVRDQYGQIIAQIKQAMVNAPLERQQALTALNTQVLQEAQNRLANLESYHLQRQSALQDWATQRMAQLNDYKLQLSQSSNFSPQEIAWNELQAGQMGGYGSIGDQTLNPMILAQKKRQSLGLV